MPPGKRRRAYRHSRPRPPRSSRHAHEQDAKEYLSDSESHECAPFGPARSAAGAAPETPVPLSPEAAATPPTDVPQCFNAFDDDGDNDVDLEDFAPFQRTLANAAK